jgi:hypothetical protein
VQTLLLDTVAWDLTTDSSGNIAVASDPYSQAQDASSAIRTFQGECYLNTALGIDYVGQIFGKRSPIALLKQKLAQAALTVPGVTSAVVLFSSIANRGASGQVQITNSNGQTAAVPFSAVSPQGIG